MSEMKERVARAIFEKHNDDLVALDDAKQWERDEYLQLAHAAIEAMLEPTEAMTEIGRKTGRRPYSVWQAMIDEALK